MEPPPNSSLVDQMVVFGREDDKNRVIEMLLSNRRSKLCVIPIVGTAGVGKTTLAHFIYNDTRVCEYFHKKGWACVVSEDLNLVRLTNVIAASFSELSCVMTELDHIQDSVRQEFRGKIFLLVLDDVWNENQSIWENICSPLSVGLRGSVILVTTRKESVARIIQTVPFYHLECLSKQNCWLVFEQCAFAGRDPTTFPNLVAIGKRIIGKCRGLPLVAKMLGGLLGSESNEEMWHDILQSSLLWDFAETKDEILPAIKLGYDGLPEKLKECFQYCALFPKDHLFKKDRLVRLWMAQGFIQPMEGKQLEDIGVEYFDELLRRCFFQYSPIDQQTFVVHDLIHDLAQSISGKECATVEDSNLFSISKEVKHVSLIPQDFRALLQLQSSYEPRVELRTFLAIHRLQSTYGTSLLPNADRLHIPIPNDIFSNMQFLQSLDLSGSDIEELPDSIDNLKYLRYLGLNDTKIRRLPESLCSLYNLQMLELQNCSDLQELPKGTKKLTNLRHLNLPRYGGYVYMPSGVGLLTSLRTLSTFYVWTDWEHCVVRELKDLVNLRGEICIKGLSTGVSADDANEANMKIKEYLGKVIFECSGGNPDFEDKHIDHHSIFYDIVEDGILLPLFSDETDLLDEVWSYKTSLVGDELEQKGDQEEIILPNKVVNRVEDVFECLQPHTNLRELVVLGYFGMRFPNWMGDPSFSNLVSVTLDCYGKCKVLPPLGQLSSLRHLLIVNLSDLEQVGHEFCSQDTMVSPKGFPSLETLEFQHMYKWEEWFGVEDGEFPRLHQLKFDNCPKLRRMPHCLPSLTKLVMHTCIELTVLSILPALTSLELGSLCNEKIWSSVPQNLLSGLQFLRICRFKDLASLPLHNLFSLKELGIFDCQVGTSPCSPLVLQLSNLVSLKCLKIHGCPGICFSEDQQLPMLQVLDIYYCPLLNEWCQRHGSSKLVHISRVILDDKDFHPISKEETQQFDQPDGVSTA